MLLLEADLHVPDRGNARGVGGGNSGDAMDEDLGSGPLPPAMDDRGESDKSTARAARLTFHRHYIGRRRAAAPVGGDLGGGGKG